MIRYMRLILLFIKLRINKSIVYSLNFWIAFFVDTILFAFQLLAFVSIYQFIDSINGWTLHQMIIFIGTFSIVDSLSMGSFFFGLLNLPELIRTGSLDMRITKPIDTQFYISVENFSPGSFARVRGRKSVLRAARILNSLATPGMTLEVTLSTRLPSTRLISV